MQVRNLLVAVVVLAVLGLGVYFSNKAKPDDDKKGAVDSPKILSIPEDQIQQVEIRRKDGRNTTLKKSDKWQITAPEALPVDSDVVSSLVSALSSMTAERVVEDKVSDAASFGLTQPSVEVVVTKKDGKTAKLTVGDETATGNAHYATIEGDPKLYTIGSFNKTSLDKTAQDLRDKRLLAFDSEKLTRVELNGGKGAVEFGRNAANEWQIVKPKPMRADNWAVEELVRKLKDAKMDTAVSDEDARKAAAAFASAVRVATASVTDATGTHVIEVRRKDKDFYAKGATVAGVYKVGNELGEGLEKTISDFLNRKLFDFGFNDPTKVETKINGQSKVFTKSGEKWTLNGQEMDTVGVQSMIDKLRDLTALRIVDKGFTTAAIELAVTAKDGKINDRVSISKTADAYHAVRAGETTVYVLDPTSVDAIEKAVADVKPASAAKADTKKK